MSKLDELIKKYSSLKQKEEERAIKLDSVNHHRMASFYKKILEDLESLEPELNDNQLIVLGWLKSSKGKYSPFQSAAILQRRNENECGIFTTASFECLTDAEQFQVLAAFASWGLNR